MGGGQTSTTNSYQVQDRQPWAPAIPGLNQALNQATDLYNSGVGQGIYGGQRVAGLTDDQSAGIQSTRDQAASDNSGAQGVSFLQNLLGSNGLSPTTQQGLGMLAGVPNVDTSRLSALADRIGDANNPINQTANAFMSGARDLTTIPQLQDLYARSQAPSAAETNLSGVARGDYLDPTTNPFVQALVKQSNQNASNATKEAFAASGRYGSGNFAGAMQKAIADVDTGLFANQYNQERQNQLSANSQIDAARQAGTTLGSGVLGQIGNVESTNNSQRLAGAQLGQGQQAAQAGVLGQVLGGDEFNSNLGVQKAQGFIGAGQQGTNAALQAAGLLPSVDALRYAPASNLLQVGGLQQNQIQNQLQSAQDTFNETQQTPWQALSEFASFPTAIGSMGGTTTTTGTQRTQTSGPSLGQQILGGISTGIGLLGRFSDERLKENVRPVGELKDGQTVYSYNYRGDPRTQIGLIAQEVAKEVPEAVGTMGLGDLLGVDYAAATDKAARLAKKGGGSSGSAPAAPPAPSGPFAAAAAQPGGLLHAALEALGGAPAKSTMIVVQSARKAPAKGSEAARRKAA